MDALKKYGTIYLLSLLPGMSLTVIQYAETIQLAVMTDARLIPGHHFPALRWVTAVEQLVNKVDQEIARISVQSIPKIIEPEQDENTEEEVVREGPSTSKLMPPTQEVVSPPPARKRIVQ